MNITATKNPTTQTYQRFVLRTSSQLKVKYPSWSQQKIQATIDQQWKKKTNQKSSSKNQSESSNSNRVNNLRMSNNKKNNISPLKLDFGQKQNNIDTREILKTKKILKRSGGNQFVKFCQFYEVKLHKQHPKWSIDQINTIVHLLWRKKSVQDSKKKKLSKAMRILSGRAFFGAVKREEMIRNPEIQMRWRLLPRQSRRYWARRGSGLQPFERTNQARRIQKQEPKTNPLNFMHKF